MSKNDPRRQKAWRREQKRRSKRQSKPDSESLMIHHKFLIKLATSQEDMPAEFSKIIDDHFEELLL